MPGNVFVYKETGILVLPVEYRVGSAQIDDAELAGGEEESAVLWMVLVYHQTDYTELAGPALTAALEVLADPAHSHAHLTPQLLLVQDLPGLDIHHSEDGTALAAANYNHHEVGGEV